MAEWSCSGLQLRVRRFDSDSSLHSFQRFLLTCDPPGPGGEIGRHKGFKIPRPSAVPVRLRSGAPIVLDLSRSLHCIPAYPHSCQYSTPLFRRPPRSHMGVARTLPAIRAGRYQRMLSCRDLSTEQAACALIRADLESEPESAISFKRMAAARSCAPSFGNRVGQLSARSLEVRLFFSRLSAWRTNRHRRHHLLCCLREMCSGVQLGAVLQKDGL